MFKVGFVGASHLGICSAIAAAEKKFNVVLYDSDIQKIKLLKKLEVNFFEPNLQKFLKKNQSRIQITNDINLLKNCKLVYISHDTPTDAQNKSDFLFVEKLIKKTLKKLNKKTLVVILCQVYPGFTEKIKWDRDYLFYQVETLIFGNAINRAINPEQIIIGKNKTNKSNSKKILEKYIGKFSKNIKYMDYKSSELSKISINLYLSSSITFANSLAELCEKSGANWSLIQEVLKKDKRIGSYAYLKPGLGILSGNLQRDLVTSQKIFKKFKCKNNYISNIRSLSSKRMDWIVNIIKQKKISKKTSIGIFGSTYKENISTLKNSPLLHIIKNLKKNSFRIFDPVNRIFFEQKNIIVDTEFENFLKFSEILIILTPWDFIKNKKNQKKIFKFKGNLIIDVYNLISRRYLNKKTSIISMGQKFKI
ncbi:nucleotide sugar dehydrogenase [Candidatus Pelagibacter communis]|uniref:nucleotide sugar dehydrogenase n=1 Tax=Pelagibacter ubique TaxID=198252 RepID=UPI00065B3793|nr:nucleotide sugar dehydrogenase [Candidatus Pelagibacter ubique]